MPFCGKEYDAVARGPIYDPVAVGGVANHIKSLMELAFIRWPPVNVGKSNGEKTLLRGLAF
jgi:hypothetical protein